MDFFRFGKSRQDSTPKQSLTERLRRSALGSAITRLFSSGTLDEDTLEELEALLLSSDIGMEGTERILTAVKAGEGSPHERLRRALCELGEQVEEPLQIDTSTDEPFVILVVGINGSGKTTTIGKLAHQMQAQGLSVMLAAGDTFRAAAVEQLQVWGERNHVPVIAQATGADAAAVLHDAVSAARSRKIDVLIADTAGRLHNHDGLMEELKKIRRVVQKSLASAPHETLLVLDGSTGQNALRQAQSFHDAIGISGIAVTKLDGSAKGGVVLNLASQLPLPVRFIGVGEKVEDLRHYCAADFVEALLAENGA